ncbi:MAG: 4-alpha-glucanotransferase [Thermoplasmata archaeon]
MAREDADPLVETAIRHGILPVYIDVAGRERAARRSTLALLLRALNVRVPGATGGVRRRDDDPVGPRVPPHRIVVGSPGSPIDLRSLAAAGDPLPRTIRLNVEGRTTWQRIVPSSNATLPLPRGTPPGRHRLRWARGTASRAVDLVLAPRRLPRGTRSRAWGLFAPVYAIRDAQTWGCGDLRALESLGTWAAQKGASILATLPLLPAFLGRSFDPSPYRPVSRGFWNEIYLAPTITPEFARSTELQRIVRSSTFRADVARLEALEHVDFRSVARLKRRVVERMVEEFGDAPERRRRAFRAFLRAVPEVRSYGRFRAAHEGHGPKAARYHVFAQWWMHEQIAGVAQRLRRRGLRLAFDLPVGVHPNGYDVGRDADAFVPSVHVGSPPDPGVPAGQDWGFPPWSPDRLRSLSYRPFAQALRHELAVAGLLRIDHVLAFHRLFWIPAGSPPRDGAYVRYPATEMYAVVNAEAARTGATIVGEDLGTVPPDVRPALSAHGWLGLYVAELEWDGPGPSRPIAEGSVVSLNTHDHLPFAGYWAVRAARGGAPERRDGFLASDRPTDVALRHALRALARSPARLLLVNVEDLWGETAPQNVPGTVGPNFSRRFRIDLGTLFERADAAELLSTIDALRRARYVR